MPAELRQESSAWLPSQFLRRFVRSALPVLLRLERGTPNSGNVRRHRCATSIPASIIVSKRLTVPNKEIETSSADTSISDIAEADETPRAAVSRPYTFLACCPLGRRTTHPPAVSGSPSSRRDGARQRSIAHHRSLHCAAHLATRRCPPGERTTVAGSNSPPAPPTATTMWLRLCVSTPKLGIRNLSPPGLTGVVWSDPWACLSGATLRRRVPQHGNLLDQRQPHPSHSRLETVWRDARTHPCRPSSIACSHAFHRKRPSQPCDRPRFGARPCLPICAAVARRECNMSGEGGCLLSRRLLWRCSLRWSVGYGGLTQGTGTTGYRVP